MLAARFAPAALLALAAGACADFDGLTAGSGGGGVLRLDGGSHPVDLAGGAADLAPPRDLAPAADLLPAPNIGPGSDVAEQVMATWDVGESVDNNVEACNPMKRGL